MEAARFKAKKAILARRLKAARSLAPGNPSASFALFLSQLGLSPPSFILDDFDCVTKTCPHMTLASLLENLDAAPSPETILHSLPPEDALAHISCLVGTLKVSRMLLRFIQRFMAKPSASLADPAAAFEEYFRIVVDALALDPAALAKKRPKPENTTAATLTRTTHSLADQGRDANEFSDAMDGSAVDEHLRGAPQRMIKVDTRTTAEQHEHMVTRVDLRQNQPRITKRFVLLAELREDRADDALRMVGESFRTLVEDVPGLTDVATGSCNCSMYEVGDNESKRSLVTYNFGVCCTFDDRVRAERYKTHTRHALAREQLLVPLLRRSPEQSICILDCLDFLEVGQSAVALSTLSPADFADVMFELAAAVQRNHDEVQKKIREDITTEKQSEEKAQSSPKLKQQPQQTEKEIQNKVMDALGGSGEIDDFTATHRVPKNREALGELAESAVAHTGQRRMVRLGLRSGPLHDLVGIADVMQKHRYDVHVQRKGCEALGTRVRALIEAGGGQIEFGSPEGSNDDAETRKIISSLVSSMCDFKNHKGIQRFGCQALSSLLEIGCLIAIVSAGGIPAVLNAMQLMLGSEEVQAVGLAILGNSQLFDPRCLRVNSSESIRAAIGAMDALPQSKQVAGLGSLALANILYKDDRNVATLLEVRGASRVCKAMRTFPEIGQVQAAGAWALAALASKDESLRHQIEESGGLALCEDAAFSHDDPAVLRNTRLAIRRIRNLDAAGDDGDADEENMDERCALS
jgi:hypothetical protein